MVSPLLNKPRVTLLHKIRRAQEDGGHLGRLRGDHPESIADTTADPWWCKVTVRNRGWFIQLSAVYVPMAMDVNNGYCISNG